MTVEETLKKEEWNVNIDSPNLHLLTAPFGLEGTPRPASSQQDPRVTAW